MQGMQTQREEQVCHLLYIYPGDSCSFSHLCVHACMQDNSLCDAPHARAPADVPDLALLVPANDAPLRAVCHAQRLAPAGSTRPVLPSSQT